MTRAPRAGEARSEAGQGTVVVLGLIGAMSALTIGWMALGSAAVAAHTARSAADLAAVAGATELADGGGGDRACATARQVVSANRAGLLACAVQPEGTVELSVGVRPGLALPGWQGRMALARSRAGPLPLRAREALDP